jgi:dipeptidase E
LRDESTLGSFETFSKERRVSGTIVAMGGMRPELLHFAVSLTGTERPRVAVLPTAQGDGDWGVMRMYELLSGSSAEVEAVRLFGIPDRPRERIAAADCVLVLGGNTANMLAVWRVHGVDEELGAAWRRGAVLGGWSAGANCWFENSVTDSFASELRALNDGLGLLAGSFCPHFDGEEERRPTYARLVSEGMPGGLGCDDAAAAVYDGLQLREVVAVEEGATAYRVEPGSEEPLEARLLL